MSLLRKPHLWWFLSNLYAISIVVNCCLNPVTSAGCTSVDIWASAKLELVDKFCYLGDMMSVDGDADAAVEARIRIGWNKFRQLVPVLTNKDVSLIMTGRLYSSCVRSSMLHGSETWDPIHYWAYDSFLAHASRKTSVRHARLFTMHVVRATAVRRS